MSVVFTRRRFLGALAAGGAILALCGKLSPSFAAGAQAGKKPLVVYYSHSGNTRRLAEEIHKRVGGDILEISTSFKYPGQYEELTKVAKEQQRENFRPPLDMKMPDMSQYGVIYLGYPNWWSGMAMPVYTFVEQSGVNGKIILPFCTHGGGGLGHSVADLKKLVPQSRVYDALSVSGTRAGAAGAEVDKWLKQMGVK